ncbi:hypothetical protein FN976_09530 [Caenimonas sedimenti]|uniref:Uncharacterized protein n=1 Tax=Caenimonas sedimenti TaxID=2596921 RepID=A0A562ZTJ4_9BURK|nr:hypothetical protein [Caenimonas sedimenti]TWO71605.1 hypothetical protein FN976_09530 [Caenimonas sedimenti]
MSPPRIAAALLLAACFPAAAQSLGPARAQAWLGRSLEFSVPARFDGTGRNDCANAEVYYGSRRIDGKHVQTFVHGAGSETRLQVLVDVPVDEPAVSVAVRAGCGSSVTRRYAVLAEPLPHEAPPPVVARAAAVVPAVASAPQPVADVRVAKAEVATRAAGAGVLPVVARVPRAQPEAPRPRMEPVAGDRPAILRVSGMLANPLGDPAQRVVAARLWQAFNAEPQELMRTTALLQSLEAELASLRLAAGRTRAEVLQVQRRADLPAAPAAASNLLPFVLLAALGVVGAALLWRRGAFSGAPAGHWYGVPATPQASVFDPEPTLPTPRQEAPASQPASTPAAAQPSLPPFDPFVPSASPASRAGPEVAAAQAVLAAKVKSARARADAKVHIFRVDALASALQEAEFLRSLGLTDDAKAVLRSHLADATSPSPLAYYELMQMCAQGEDEAREIPLLRRRFHEKFEIVAPSMDELNAPGGLECHPKLAARIAAVWPTPPALDIIEKRLFAKPESSDYQISLEAWRDLVWLYDLAQHMQMGPAAAAMGQRAESAVMAPWADLDTGGFDLSGGDFGRAHNFAVDFDLNAAAAPDEWSEGELTLEPLPRPALAQ